MERLTKSEMVILKLLIKGYDNLMISKTVFVSVHTVKAHVSSILKKLNAKNRTNAAYIALKNNLVDE
jgi:DNA-binding NarL/FixJ family response regulator